MDRSAHPSLSKAPGQHWRTAVAGAGAAALGFGGLHFFPALEVRLFSAGAAKIAGVFYATPVVQSAEGWLLQCGGRPVIVTEACSGSGFFVVLAVILAAQFARRGFHWSVAPFAAIAAAIPATLLVNAIRLVAVVQVHAWLIPRLPPSFGAFLHLLTGVAVFLPALIALNIYLENHGHTRHAHL